DADTDYVGRDTLERKVTITPAHVFQGETNQKYTVSFTAPGPMYGAVLRVPIPAGLQPTAVGTLSASSGVTAAFTATDNTTSLISIDLTTINVGQRVSVTYTLDEIGATASDFLLAGTTGDMTTDDVTTSIDGGTTAIRVTTLAGGKASAVGGSGRVALTPSAAEAGAPRVNITATYTAHTDLKGVDIEITAEG
ncbi:hypothetical protein J4G02_12105, partial [Candidatus Poribacteria bacterium]|nr:hypothetical protein [Candidatus Poribacteria bacterium]